MKTKELVYDPKKCIGCRLCEQICTMSHFEITNPAKALIRITRDDEKQLDSAVFCRTCADAPCIKACQYDALSWNSKTNAIQIDKENCVACMDCMNDCSFRVPIMHPTDDYILICDLCNGNPECVSICPENAIEYLDFERASQKVIKEEN